MYNPIAALLFNFNPTFHLVLKLQSYFVPGFTLCLDFNSLHYVSPKDGLFWPKCVVTKLCLLTSNKQF